MLARVATLCIVVISLLPLAAFAQSAPTITSLSPTVGPVPPAGGPVTIKGTNFGSQTGTVTFGGTSVTVTSWSDTRIVVSLPTTLPVGFLDVIVTANGVSSNTQSFLLIPTILQVSPLQAIVDTPITLTGTSFGGQPGTVTFNGTLGVPTAWSNTSITVPVPKGTTNGGVVVTVNGFQTNGVPFYIVPNIVTLTPNSGLVNTQVIITGNGFGGAPGFGGVTFNGVNAALGPWSDTSISATVPQGATTGTVVVTASNLLSSGGVPFTVGIPPVLSSQFAPTVTSVTLTSPLASDWQHWGTSDTFPVVSDGVVSPILNGFTVIGASAATNFGDGEIEYSWADGDMVFSADRTTTGVSVRGVGNGFHLSVPAGTSPQTIILYVGAWEAQGRLTASLSDNSVPAFTDSSVDIVATNGDHHVNGTYTLSFVAGQSDQTLNIDYVLAVDHGAAHGSAGNVSLQSAVLLPTQPSVLLTAPSANQTFSPTSPVPLAANASQIGAAIGKVSFFSDAQEVLDVSSAPYGGNLTGLSPGDHSITATATDANGLLTTSMPVLISEVGAGGLLTAFGDTPVSVDLSAGTSDWAHWSSATSDRKAGVMPQISVLKTLANGSAHPFDASGIGGVSYSWNSGTPTDAQAGTATQVRMQAYKNGFKLTVPADTTLRTLKLYTASGLGESTLRASLSDGSATPFVSAFSTPMSFVEKVYTIQFQAASAGQTLVLTDQVTRDDGFAYVALESASVSDQNPPHIDALTAVSGKPGDPITITGINFGGSQGNSSVSLNGALMKVISWSDSAITATIPLVESGAVVVSRVLANSNGVAFTVVLPPPPAISFISPGAGAAETKVTIFGSNFGIEKNNSTVTFKGLLASPISWSDSVISVPAPVGVHSGPVVVTTASGSSNGVQFTFAPGVRSSLQSVYVTPDEASLAVEGSVTFTLVNPSGNPVTDATWTVDNSALATITAADSTPSKGILHALGTGEVTVTATSSLGTAQGKATIYAVGSAPAGTPAWGFYPQTQDYSFAATIKAFANSKFPDAPFMYLPEGNFVDTTAVNALDETGRLQWRVQLNPITPTNTIFFPVVAAGTNDGGILVQTNEADPNGPSEATGFYRLDPAGKPLWTYSVPTVTAFTPAIGPDGTTYFWAQFTDSGTQLIALDDTTGTEKFRFTANPGSLTNFISAEQPSDTRPDGIKVDATHPWMPCAAFFPPGQFDPPDPIGTLRPFQPIVTPDTSVYFPQVTQSSSVVYDKCTVSKIVNSDPNNPAYKLNTMSGTIGYNESLTLYRLTSSGLVASTPFGGVSFSGQAALTSDFEFFQWNFNGGASQLPTIGAFGVAPHPDGGVLVQWLQSSSAKGDTGIGFLTAVQNDTQTSTNPLPADDSMDGAMATNDKETVFFDNFGKSVTAVDIPSVKPKWNVPGALFAATSDGGALIKHAGSIQSVDENGNVGTDSLPVSGSSTFLAEGTVADTQSGVGGKEEVVRTSSPQLRSFLASPWAIPGVADPSSTYSGSFYTKLVTIIGWINGSPSAVAMPPQSSVNPALVKALSEPTSCLVALTALRLGDRSLIQSDIDRQYANAFLISHSANNEPPPDLTTGFLERSVASKGDYRGYNEVRAELYTQGSQISSVRLAASKAKGGDTPDACKSFFARLGNFIANGALERSEDHPDNGKSGITTLQSHFFHLNEGRVGSQAQAVNMTLNACTSKNQDGLCNAPVPPVTPYIWSFPLFDATGAYAVNTQIFPTYYVYEEGKLVKKIPQTALENFIKMNAANSQVLAKDIK